MKLIDYQLSARRTAKVHEVECMNDFQYCIGMMGELGEVMEHIKKGIFQGYGIDIQELKLELGDFMWYFANFCTYHDIDMEEVLSLNHDKLMKRYPNGFFKRGE